MKPLIFDSTPLIYLTKAGLSRIFRDLKGEKMTPSSVKREVVDEGVNKGIPDAIVLDKLFVAGAFSVCEPSEKAFLARLQKTRGLHFADAEVLTLAYEHNGIAITDDEVARKTAKVYGIDFAGSPYVLMLAVCEELVSKAQAKQAFNDMISSGWRCNVETYMKIMEEEVKKQENAELLQAIDEMKTILQKIPNEEIVKAIRESRDQR